LGNGLKPMVFGDGSQKYDFVAVQDCARANICALKADVSGECYNVGRGIGTSILDLTKLLIKLSGVESEIQYEPEGLTFVTNRIGSIEKAENDLGYKWTIDLEEGMQALIDWRSSHIEDLAARREKLKV